ncbi:MAG TPA: hypothetical protein VFV51_19015 [Vicinamibacterales bacterium]|nr:hypothetical protein [Vicinamibacterales bacterium]
MHATTLSANPFGLLTDPQAILDAMQRSPRLESLNRRICRPLDRPAPVKPGEQAPEPVIRSGDHGEESPTWIG